MRHPSLWLILNYPPQIKKEDQKTGSQYIYIYRRRIICIAMIIVTAAANYIAPDVFFSFCSFFFFLYHHRTTSLSLSFSFNFCLCLVDPVSRNTIVRIRSDRISLLPMSSTPLSSVSLSSETLMERMYGKTRLPFTRDNEKRKKSSRPSPTWFGNHHWLLLFVAAKDTIDDFDVRWIYVNDYDRFGCRHTLLSIVSFYLNYFFFSYMLFSHIFSFFSSLPLPVSILLFVPFSFFSFSTSVPLRCCMYVFVCVFFFFVLVLARLEALINWLGIEQPRASRAAFGVTWSEMYGDITPQCVLPVSSIRQRCSQKC